MQLTDASTDLDGSIAAWTWRFGDGSPASNDPNPQHTYSLPGDYPVTLTVVDNDGGSASVTNVVHVNAV